MRRMVEVLSLTALLGCGLVVVSWLLGRILIVLWISRAPLELSQWVYHNWGMP